MEQSTPQDAPEHDGVLPETEETTETEEATSGPRVPHAVVATLTALGMILVMALISGRLESLASDAIRFFKPAPEADRAIEATVDAPDASAETIYSFERLDIHPDVMLRPYTAGPVVADGVASSTSEMIEQFRELLALYAQRQGVDDNFTIRVVDRRDDEMLELYVLDEERDRYEQLGENDPWEWGRIDRMRRDITRELVRKWVARGIPQEDITVKWGRANQVREARKREEAFIEYEIRLARYLGLSLLATEIGTVETFNADRLVSSVGARSRYQMMPYILRQHGIHHYSLPTAAGNRISVYEEWHPLITMEASFRTLAGYINAVGHEIPGISAYHTGPGNIYSVYRMFLTEQGAELDPAATVMDAYMWAVTTGYDKVSATSSFKSYSRGYVASAYGALRATENEPIDTSKTMRAERVQIAGGESALLSTLLTTLSETDAGFPGLDSTRHVSAYDRFRELNPHILLPESDNGGIPPRGNVRLTAEAGGEPVRFFLPLGATAALRAAGLDVFDADAGFTYDRDTYGRPRPTEVTVWDRRYRELVDEVAAFGFNADIRQRLYTLADRFEDLAEANPSHYRRTQLDVIRTHERIWRSRIFDRLADVVSDARGRSRMQSRPLSPLNTTSAALPPARGGR